MGIRETLNQNPGITTGATIGIIVIALGFIIYQLVGNSGPPIPTKSFYVTDDSSPEAAKASLFKDKIDKIPPFDKDGKQAYRAYVYTCDGGKTQFIGYLERYTADGKAKLEAARAHPNNPNIMVIDDWSMFMEIKRPGDTKWVKMSDSVGSAKVTDIRCPDGGTNMELVNP